MTANRNTTDKRDTSGAADANKPCHQNRNPDGDSLDDESAYPLDSYHHPSAPDGSGSADSGDEQTDKAYRWQSDTENAGGGKQD